MSCVEECEMSTLEITLSKEIFAIDKAWLSSLLERDTFKEQPVEGKPASDALKERTANCSICRIRCLQCKIAPQLKKYETGSGQGTAAISIISTALKAYNSSTVWEASVGWWTLHACLPQPQCLSAICRCSTFSESKLVAPALPAIFCFVLRG